MEKKLKVAIVGANGVIGTVLQKGLTEFDITPLGRDRVDSRSYNDLVAALKGQDSVIYLARNPNKDRIRETFRTGEYDPDNSLMTFNIYKAAMEAKVKRVIMASSVHADNFYTFQGSEKVSVERMPTPDSPYGANKLFMEFLGKYFSTKGLEVICIRFGGINQNNSQPDESTEQAVWLTHEDCIAMMKACLQAKYVPDNFSVFYAVSNNRHAIHDIRNPFGWKPI